MQESELILNPDGSIYHLAILPEDIADIVVTVGDPNRVEIVSRYFDSIEIKKSNREFVIHTGMYSGKRMTCLSTGMGTDNIDIVLNELDALVNIDLQSRTIKQDHTSLTLVRIGTSGSIHKDVKVGSVVATELAIGLESLFAWYTKNEPNEKETKWLQKLNALSLPVKPFASSCDQDLMNKFSASFQKGVTVTAGGFYAPQNRMLRLSPAYNIIEKLQTIEVDGQSVTNMEMETAGIYGLSKLLGHKAISINAIMASRLTGEFATDPETIMAKTIQTTLDILCKS